VGFFIPNICSLLKSKLGAAVERYKSSILKNIVDMERHY
jgi:hypothetical protein